MCECTTCKCYGCHFNACEWDIRGCKRCDKCYDHSLHKTECKRYIEEMEYCKNNASKRK